MKTIEIVVTVLFLIGGIALIATVIKYPKDVAKGVFIETPKAFLYGIGNRLWFILIPIWGPLWLLDAYFKWNIFERLQMSFDSDYKYRGTKRKINFVNFKRFILTNEIDKNKIAASIQEASETIRELDISEHRINQSNGYSLIELPNAGFYGFNFLIQWLTEELKGTEVYGYASNNRTDFFLYQDPLTTNNLIGRTNKGKRFSVSMYDDLDKENALRMNERIKVDKEVTTDFFSKLVVMPSI